MQGLLRESLSVKQNPLFRLPAVTNAQEITGQHATTRRLTVPAS